MLTRNKARALKCVKSRKCTTRRRKSIRKKKVMSLTEHLILLKERKLPEVSKWWMLE